MLNLRKKQKAKRNDSTSNVWIDWRRTRCLNCLLKCRSALIGSSPFSDCTKERKAKVLSFDLSICGSSADRPGRVQWSRTTDPAMFELNKNMRSAFSQGTKKGSKNIWLNEGAEGSSIHALHPILDADWNCWREVAINRFMQCWWTDYWRKMFPQPQWLMSSRRWKWDYWHQSALR